MLKGDGPDDGRWEIMKIREEETYWQASKGNLTKSMMNAEKDMISNLFSEIKQIYIAVLSGTWLSWKQW